MKLDIWINGSMEIMRVFFVPMLKILVAMATKTNSLKILQI
jgi:hypothetical protein